MELPQDGEVSQARYVVGFSPEYDALLREARTQMRDAVWEIFVSKGKEFSVAVEQASEVDQQSASAVDISSLVRYFAYRGKSMEDIDLNMKYRLKP